MPCTGYVVRLALHSVGVSRLGETQWDGGVSGIPGNYN